jgi:hypothetical protein
MDREKTTELRKEKKRKKAPRWAYNDLNNNFP